MLNFGNKEFRNLQEQVLKNAQDIETLKGRENLQIVIVEELPETGNPNYIYLVPNNDEEEANVYDEYIWLADSEEYEKIGGVDIDLTNYVTLDSEQSITGLKTINRDGTVLQLYKEDNSYGYIIEFVSSGGESGMNFRRSGMNFGQFSLRLENYSIVTYALRPTGDNAYDIGKSDKRYKDLYLSGNIYFDSTHKINLDAGFITFNINSSNYALIGTNFSMFRTIIPAATNAYNLGRSDYCWNDFYITGNISDGVNSVTVANIASKVTSTFISGTFDSNGESTIDTEQAGTPEGLFIFTYGNCQCFLHLTATMVQNADTTPIRVSIPMIYNSDTVNGWLNITKSGYILILKITDGTNHVDSGYAWTLTKTNLI